MKNKKGFTIIEILIVIIVIAVLSAIAAPTALTIIEKSKTSKTLNDMKTFKTAILTFYSDVGFFPADPGKDITYEGWQYDPGLWEKTTKYFNSSSLKALGFDNDLEGYLAIVNSRWNGPYIDFPFTKRTAWGGRYDYECWGPGVGRTPTNLPDGIYITIHEIPEKGAKLLVEASTFEVVGGSYFSDDVSKLKKVTLKITSWVR